MRKLPIRAKFDVPVVNAYRLNFITTQRYATSECGRYAAPKKQDE